MENLEGQRERWEGGKDEERSVRMGEACTCMMHEAIPGRSNEQLETARHGALGFMYFTHGVHKIHKMHKMNNSAQP